MLESIVVIRFKFREKEMAEIRHLTTRLYSSLQPSRWLLVLAGNGAAILRSRWLTNDLEWREDGQDRYFSEYLFRRPALCSWFGHEAPGDGKWRPSGTEKDTATTFTWRMKKSLETLRCCFVVPSWEAGSLFIIRETWLMLHVGMICRNAVFNKHHIGKNIRGVSKSSKQRHSCPTTRKETRWLSSLHLPRQSLRTSVNSACFIASTLGRHNSFCFSLLLAALWPSVGPRKESRLPTSTSVGIEWIRSGLWDSWLNGPFLVGRRVGSRMGNGHQSG